MYSLFIYISVSFFTTLQGDFLTEFEYAEMLYKDPRGISCKECHGDKGESLIVLDYYSHYRNSKKKRELVIEPINSLSYDRFRRGLFRRNRFMPIYRLSNQEIKAIYFYLQKVNNKIDENKEINSTI